MRTRQNSGRSTVPNLGISRGVPLPYRQERLIENARLTSKLTSKNSSQLRISNRERMAISRRTVSRLSSFEPQAPSLQILIANLELEFHLTGCTNNHMQFSNRKYFAISRCIYAVCCPASRFSGSLFLPPASSFRPPKPLAAASWAANRDTAIRISRNPNKHTRVQNPNRDKTGTFEIRFSPHRAARRSESQVANLWPALAPPLTSHEL